MRHRTRSHGACNASAGGQWTHEVARTFRPRRAVACCADRAPVAEVAKPVDRWAAAARSGGDSAASGRTIAADVPQTTQQAPQGSRGAAVAAAARVVRTIGTAQGDSGDVRDGEDDEREKADGAAGRHRELVPLGRRPLRLRRRAALAASAATAAAAAAAAAATTAGAGAAGLLPRGEAEGAHTGLGGAQTEL